MTNTPNRLLCAVALSLVLTPTTIQGQQDFSKVEIKTTKISGNFYTLEGQGGVIGVLAGPDGIFMVDTQFAPLTEKIVAAIRQISDRPIRFVVNTHLHGDHTGGNANLGKMGATILARDELRARLAKPNPSASGAPGTPAPATALPMILMSESADGLRVAATRQKAGKLLNACTAAASLVGVNPPVGTVRAKVIVVFGSVSEDTFAHDAVALRI